MPISIALDISIKNIFSTYALKRFVWFLPYWPHPAPQYFLYPSKKTASAIVISSHVKEKQSMHHLKSLKEKTQ